MSDDKPRTTRHGTIIPSENDEQQDEQFDFGNYQPSKRNQPRYDANDPRGFRTHSNPFYGERDIMDNFEYNEDEN